MQEVQQAALGNATSKGFAAHQAVTGLQGYNTGQQLPQESSSRFQGIVGTVQSGTHIWQVVHKDAPLQLSV